VGALDELERRVPGLQLGHQFVAVESLRIAVIEIEADGGVEHLRAHFQCAAEFIGSLGFSANSTGMGSFVL